MKAKFVAALMVFASTLLISSPALADLCVDNGTTDFCLDNTNTGIATGDIILHVTLNGGVLNVHVGSANPGFTNLRIDMFAFNNSSGGNLFTGLQPSGATVSWDTQGGGQMDGFGNFTSHTQGGGNNSNDLTWNLGGAPSFSGNEIFVAHVRYNFNGQDCSAFISNAPGATPGSDTHCGSSEIPEPGSLALLGTGLFSAVGVLRRKLLKA